MLKNKRNVIKISPGKMIYLIIVMTIITSNMALSKYQSTAGGKNSTQIANFSVGISNAEEIDLFSTVNSENEDIMSGKLAPGTTGSFEVIIENNSDVAVEYVISLDETENTDNIPIEYSLDGINYVVAKDIANKTDAMGTLNYKTNETLTKKVTIYWRWALTGKNSTCYQENQTSDTDTKLGQYSESVPIIKVKVEVNFIQKD